MRNKKQSLPLQLEGFFTNNNIICGIYKITNKINGKCYIGQSINIKERWQAHLRDCFNSHSKAYDYPLYKAIRKYGLNNFQFDIILECDQKELNIQEMYYIQIFNSYSNGYNQSLGGEKGKTGYTKISKEVLDIILDSLSKKTVTYSDIGKQVGLRHSTIIFIAHKYNLTHEKLPRQKKVIDSPKKPPTKPSKEELKELLDKKLYLYEIADIYKVVPQTIRKWIRKYNLTKIPHTNPKLPKPHRNIKQILPSTGEIINIFSSTREAVQSTGISMDSIERALNKSRKTGGGFCWEFV